MTFYKTNRNEYLNLSNCITIDKNCSDNLIRFSMIDRDYNEEWDCQGRRDRQFELLLFAIAFNKHRIIDEEALKVCEATMQGFDILTGKNKKDNV